MKNAPAAEQRFAVAKRKLIKHLSMVGWLLFAVAIAEWRKFSAGGADAYVPDLARWQALLPLALLGLLYLWDARGRGALASLFGVRWQVPGWAWLILFAAGALLPALFS